MSSSASLLEVGGKKSFEAGQIAAAGGRRERPKENAASGQAVGIATTESDACTGACHELPRVGRADLKGLRDLPVRVLEALSQHVGGTFRWWKGSTYWRGGFLAQLGFVETSARNWQAALEAMRELADIFATTKMVDIEALLWGVDYADAALQVGAMQDVEAAIAVLRRQASAGRPEAAAAADRCEALLKAARGDVDDALNELRAIVDRTGSGVHSRQRGPGWLWDRSTAAPDTKAWPAKR